MIYIYICICIYDICDIMVYVQSYLLHLLYCLYCYVCHHFHSVEPPWNLAKPTFGRFKFAAYAFQFHFR